MFISPNIPLNSTAEVPGEQKDLGLLVNDKWLLNTEVCYWIQERISQWHLSMIYIATDNPLKLICRKIDIYYSEKKAMTFARILQRGIRKDERGTLKTNHDAFNICDN